MENKFVYVITKGRYSDYHICAITMDENRAERMKKLYSDRYDEARIETYVLDEDKTTGSIYYVEFENDGPAAVRMNEYTEYDNYDNGPVVDSWYNPIRVYVRAKDEAYALKVAQDKYAEWKAEKAGVV